MTAKSEFAAALKMGGKRQRVGKETKINKDNQKTLLNNIIVSFFWKYIDGKQSW